MLQEHELEIKNREENIKNNNGGDYFNNRKNYFERMRESYYNYIALKNTYENVLDFWSRAFYYPKFFNLFGLVPLLKPTSFEKYMAFIAEKDYKNKITFDKINVYFGKR